MPATESANAGGKNPRVEEDPDPKGNLKANSNPTLMTIVLPAEGVKGEGHYAIIPFPMTYKEATQSAVNALGKYMLDPTPENVILKCTVKNRIGGLVWANIAPENWLLTLREYPNEVAIFESRERNIAEDKLFMHGKVSLTSGKWSNSAMMGKSEIEWSRVQLSREKPSAAGYPSIERPKNWQQAVELVHRQGVFKDSQDLVFFGFLSRDTEASYYAFPENAYSDDVVWRRIVPENGNILGVMLRSDAP